MMSVVKLTVVLLYVVVLSVVMQWVILGSLKPSSAYFSLTTGPIWSATSPSICGVVTNAN